MSQTDDVTTSTSTSTSPTLPDLASRALGGSVVFANDELFADRENLITAEAPTFQPRTFGHKGQVMDGWETRRRREPGSDHVIVRLGCAGIIRRVVVDTSFFTGNYPPEVSVDACGAEGYPAPPELAAADWTSVVARSKVGGDAVNEFEVSASERFTHVRLTMFPDGGVARLRVYGEVVPDPRLLPATFDLAALDAGALVTGCSNMFYSSPSNLIMPGNARSMGDGWETSRRRDDGNDWVALRLACAGTIDIAELDTSCFIGNAPGWAGLSDGADGVVLERTALMPDTRHRFAVRNDHAVEHVRLDIYPDGGMARLRLYGTPTNEARAALAQRFVAHLPESHRVAALVAAGMPGDEAQRLVGGGPITVAELPPLVQHHLAGTRGT
jgi:allantoicase